MSCSLCFCSYGFVCCKFIILMEAGKNSLIGFGESFNLIISITVLLSKIYSNYLLEFKGEENSLSRLSRTIFYLKFIPQPIGRLWCKKRSIKTFVIFLDNWNKLFADYNFTFFQFQQLVFIWFEKIVGMLLASKSSYFSDFERFIFRFAFTSCALMIRSNR